MTPPPTTPSDRAAAVLRAAETAANAGRPAPAAPPPPVAAPEGRAADGLLASADRLAGEVAGAQVRLQALKGALERLAG